MSGQSSAVGYYLIAKQSGKGVAATSGFKKYRAGGPASLAPMKDRQRYSMTDVGRDVGDSYTSGIRVEGELPVHAHPDGIATLLYGALGANADAGSTPNFTHTITPADDLPWFTIWRGVANQITELFTDCKFNTLRLESAAGSPVLGTIGVVGIQSEWLAEPSFSGGFADPYKHWEGKGEFKIATVAHPIHDITLEINNNLIPYQADDFILSDVDPGKREIDLSLGLHYQSPVIEPKYREFLYSSDSGTQLSAAVATKQIDLKWTRDADTSLAGLFPQVRYAAVPVNLDPSGDPIDVEVACAVEKPSGSVICTFTVKDQNQSV